MNQISRCQSLLGTFVSVDVIADASDASILSATDGAFGAIKLVQKCFSYHDINSELSQLNARAHIKPFPMSSMMCELLTWCLNLSHDSGGLFDVSVAPLLVGDKRLPNHWPNIYLDTEEIVSYQSVVISKGRVLFKQPMTLDFGGVAKGLAVDLALKSVETSLSGRLENAVVNAGGDMRAFDWDGQKVGIVDCDKNVIRHDMKAASVASSSGYYQNGLSEIYHPHTQRAKFLKKTTSVFAESCQLADALTKVAVLDGSHPLLLARDAEVLVT